MSAIWLKITSALSGDIAFLAVLFVIIFLCIMYFGRNRMISLVLAFYPAVFLYKSFPYLNKLIFLSGDVGITMNKIIVFVIIFSFVNFVVRKYIDLFSESGSLFQKGASALAVLIIFPLFSYNVISLDLLHNFSSSIDALFNNGNLTFWWNLIPISLLLL